MIEESIRSFLVTTLGHSRIYAQVMPQNATMPSVTYDRISANRETTLSGAVSLVSARIQIDFFADDFATARNDCNTAISALHSYTGYMGSPQTKVQLASVDSERDEYDDDAQQYKRSIDVIFSYEE